MKSLQEQMNQARSGYGIKQVDNKYDPKGTFKDVLTVDAACKVAQIYAIEQQIEIVNSIRKYGEENFPLDFIGTGNSTSAELEMQSYNQYWDTILYKLNKDLKQLQEEQP